MEETKKFNYHANLNFITQYGPSLCHNVPDHCSSRQQPNIISGKIRLTQAETGLILSDTNFWRFVLDQFAQDSIQIICKDIS